MRRILRTTAAALATAGAVGLAAAPATAAALPHRAEATAPAYFVMTDVTGEQFIVKMTDQEDIDHARALLEGRTHDLPHILGRIVKRPAEWNGKWSYHYDPASITFFDVSIEVCDASMTYVEQHLDEAGGAFLPGVWWCPWSSRLVRELPTVD